MLWNMWSLTKQGAVAVIGCGDPKMRLKRQLSSLAARKDTLMGR